MYTSIIMHRFHQYGKDYSPESDFVGHLNSPTWGQVGQACYSLIQCGAMED